MPAKQNKIIRIPIQKNLCWNKNRPILKLNQYGDFTRFYQGSCPINVHNIAGQYIGYGLYNHSEQLLIHLSDHAGNLKDICAERLKQAVKARESIFTLPCYRLIHHFHDRLPHVIIDRYNNIYCIRTFCAASDLLIPFLSDCLTNDFNAEAVLLKNTFHKRQVKGLITSDQILAGGLKDNIIPVYENDFTFFYDTKANLDPFPCYMRPLRLELNSSMQNSKTRGNMLFIGIAPEITISEQTKCHTDQIQHIIIKDRFLSEITDQLRRLEQQRKEFDAIVFNHPVLTATDKNKTALFHLYYHLLKLTHDASKIYLQIFDWKVLKQIWQHCAHKQNIALTFTILEAQNTLQDHYGSLPDHAKQTGYSVLIEVKK